MISLHDQYVRNLVKKRLAELRPEIIEDHGKCLKLSDLDDIFASIRRSYKQSALNKNTNLSPHSSLVNLQISSCYCLSKAIYSVNEEQGYLFPRNWIEGRTKPDPNMIFSNLILTLVKTSISTVYLLESGFDNQARSLGRNLAELCWQILILAFYKDKLNIYIAPSNVDEANQAWYKLFGKGKISRSLKHIEKNIGLSGEALQEFIDLRKNVYSWLSLSLHNSYATSMINHYSWDFKNDQGEFCDFAGKSDASISTLQYVNDILWYFHRIFFATIFNYHKLRPMKPKRKF